MIRVYYRVIGSESMRVLIQRVAHASVAIAGKPCGSIQQGFLLLVGIKQGDSEETALKLAKKVAELRVFEDAQGKMNLSLKEVNGAILSISQFTLYADCRRGRRPGFEQAEKPQPAKRLYEFFNEQLTSYGIHVETGVFGADMKVELCNDGPVTILLDSAEW